MGKRGGREPAEGPGTAHAVVHVLSANDAVRILGRDGRWLQVERVEKDDAVQGWIFGTL